MVPTQCVRRRHGSNQAMVLCDLEQASGKAQIKAETTAKTNTARQAQYSVRTHNAAFMEVIMSQDLGTVHVSRVVNAVAVGRIINSKTARNQVLGSVMRGVGMALMEESVMDHRFDRYMNHT